MAAALVIGLVAPVAPAGAVGGTTVVGWGRDDFGQATAPAGLTDATAIGAGMYHSLAIRGDGTVVGWGMNDYGQATPPAGLTDVRAVDGGRHHSIALQGDGTVAVWGRDMEGQSTPPLGLTNVVAVAAGGYFSLALKGDGTVVAWGENSHGEATPPAGLSGATRIAAGDYCGFALSPAGWVFWGSLCPLSAPDPLPDFVAVEAGYEHAVGLKADGTVMAWGLDNHGQASPPAGLSGVTQIAAGYAHSMALKGDGTVVAWGYNATPPAGLSGVTTIAAGEHSLAIGPAQQPPQAQSISWTTAPPASVTAGQAFPVAASATSGLAVVLATTGPCGYGSGAVTTTGPGTCTVLANQAGNAQWLPAPQLSAAVTVNPALPAVRVRLKAIGKKSKLRVDVNPNKGRGYWTFRVQRLGRDDGWLTLPKVYKTLGAKERRTVNLRRGTYRVVVDAKYNYEGATSNQVYLRR